MPLTDAVDDAQSRHFEENATADLSANGGHDLHTPNPICCEILWARWREDHLRFGVVNLAAALRLHGIIGGRIQGSLDFVLRTYGRPDHTYPYRSSFFCCDFLC